LVTVTAKDRVDLGKLLIKVAQEARQVITPAVIQKSFERTGIVPWNPQLILERAKLNVGKIPKDNILANDHYDGLVNLVKDTIQTCLGEEEYDTIDFDPWENEIYDGATILKLSKDKAKVIEEKKTRKK